MKKQKFLTARRILFVLTLAVIIAIPTATLRAQSSDEPTTPQTTGQGGGILDVLEQIRQAQAQQIEGSWTIVLTPIVPPGVPQPTFTAYSTFARGGAFIGSARTNAFSFGANPQHGVWEHRGGNGFAFIFKQDLLDVTGKFTNVLIGNARLTVNGRDEFAGVTNAELRDANGNLVMNLGCATFKGTRIKIEPLADQCQSITPPQ